MKNSKIGVFQLDIFGSTKLKDLYMSINNISVYNPRCIEHFGSFKFLEFNQQVGFQKWCYHKILIWQIHSCASQISVS